MFFQYAGLIHSPEKIGVMFQNPEHQLFNNTVEDEIDFSLKNLRLEKEELEKEIYEPIFKQ